TLFFQAVDGIRGKLVTGVQTCALPISRAPRSGGPHAKLGSASLPALTVAREAPVTRNATSPLPPDATYLVAPRSSTLGGVRSTEIGRASCRERVQRVGRRGCACIKD